MVHLTWSEIIILFSDLLVPKREMKVDDESSIKQPLNTFGYPSFPNPAMFTPSQLLMASQIMTASGLSLSSNPAFFHPGLLPIPWAASSPPSTYPHSNSPSSSSPPSPPTSTEQLSPTITSRKLHNNNNNVVTSSTSITDIRKRRYKNEEDTSSIPLPSPTSSASPPSGPETKDTNRDKQFTCGVCNR